VLRRQHAESRSSAVPLDQLPECCSYQARTRSMLLELQGRLAQADRLR
jgi:hypothetical protein